MLQVHGVAMWIKEMDHGYLLLNVEDAELKMSILKQKIWVSNEQQRTKTRVLSLNKNRCHKLNTYL